MYRDDLWRVRVLQDVAFAGICMLVPHRHVEGVTGRPLGYLDLRGSVLVEWEEVLPRATEEEVLAAAADLRSRLQP